MVQRNSRNVSEHLRTGKAAATHPREATHIEQRISRADRAPELQQESSFFFLRFDGCLIN